MIEAVAAIGRGAECFEGSPFAGKLWLAPLTVGGNLPFRRLCVELGAEVTVSEMVVVRNLQKGRSAEFALLKSHTSEPCFGVQIADRSEAGVAEGARVAEARGARFVDLNCGCPIFEITRRGLGASLLRKPGRLSRLVAAIDATLASASAMSAPKLCIDSARSCARSSRP